MNYQTKLKVAVFLDGRPGHEKQTYGIITQLRKFVEVEVLKIQVSKLSAFKYLKSIIKYILPFFKGGNGLAGDCDVLIGTGSHTHIPMLLCKKEYGIPVVTCMTPAIFLLNRFDLIFSPKHDNVTPSENVVTTLGPPNSNENHGLHNSDSVLVLVGGVDDKSHYWKSELLIVQIKQILRKTPNKKFIISTSPRTPADTSAALAGLQESFENVKFFDFKETPSGWVEEAYKKCKYVWVTADSISMVYEALSSGCCVGVIPVLWKKKSSKFINSESFLSKSGYIIRLDEYLEGKQDWHDSEPLNEAKRCADILLKKLQWKN